MGATGYLNKDEVDGTSFEVGAKVVYRGCEMTVTQAPDGDGEIKMNNPAGFLALCAALPAMKELKELKYASTRLRCCVVLILCVL